MPLSCQVEPHSTHTTQRSLHRPRLISPQKQPSLLLPRRLTTPGLSNSSSLDFHRSRSKLHVMSPNTSPSKEWSLVNTCRDFVWIDPPGQVRIKTEPAWLDEDDDDDDNPSSSKSKKSASPGQKSARAFEYGPKNSFMSGVRDSGSESRGCPHITIITSASRDYLKLTRVLIDTSAPANFVSRRIAKKICSEIYKVSPIGFDLPNGLRTVHDEQIEFGVWIAGIRQPVKAYIDDSRTSAHMIFGNPAQQQFLMEIKARQGTNCERRIFVAQDVKGFRRLKFCLQEDEGHTKKEHLSRADAMAFTRSQALTISEVKAREQRGRYANEWTDM